MRKEEILAIRKSMGFNQERFADLLGTTLTTVCRWETGKSSPRMKYIGILSRMQLNQVYIKNFKKNIEQIHMSQL